MQLPTPFIEVDENRHRFRVNRLVMTSPEVLEQERAQIFDRCWLYLGHESEIPERGDFVSRTLARRPLILCRDMNGVVRVLLNACTHRGAQVCREEKGNAKRFRCFYHGWTFENTGRLVVVPDREGYPENVRDHLPDLPSPPGVDSYRGFVFVRFTNEGPSLPDYLAGTKKYLDYVSEKTETGIEVVEGTHRYSMAANWKLLIENSFDGYHPTTTHHTYLQALKTLGETGATFRRRTVAEDLGNGHAITTGPSVFGRPVARWTPSLGEEFRPVVEERRKRLVELHGEERAERIAEWDFNMAVFPNLMVIDFLGLVVRTVDPLAPDRTSVTAWMLGVRDEPAELRQAWMRSALSFFGPAGMATPDDVEALESCQRGFGSAGEYGWSDLSRGLDVPLEEQTNRSEMNLRLFWREWNRRITCTSGGAA